MKHPDLIPTYAHLLCNEKLSEAIEDTSQDLFQQAVHAGLLQPDEYYGESVSCSEPMMMRLLEVSTASAEEELRRLADRLEDLLLQEFSTTLIRH
ncbi:hypothetical protein [Teichococcus oryzae]|uniref:Uncharacterized protein n=1 Tax=Teichococcus oryzae TaxID=1608942 RepID=A0A5B2TEG6_9PROT|nr:hypothetical protein [Pseudoroseomonas oryzae]KAA2212847.1 hypothetical protein F0Q34_11985 [Pseudoroseomonas oryzae]